MPEKSPIKSKSKLLSGFELKPEIKAKFKSDLKLISGFESKSESEATYESDTSDDEPCDYYYHVSKIN